MLNLFISIFLGLFLLIFIAFLIKEKKLFFKYSTIFYVPILIIMFVIFYYGLDVENQLGRIHDSLSNAILSITFKDSFEEFNNVYRNDFWFVVNYYIGLLFIGFITFSMVIDLFFRQAINFLKAKFILNDTVVVLMEDDEEAKTFLSSFRNRYVIIDEKNKPLEKYLLNNNIVYKVGINKKHLLKLSKTKGVKFISFLKNHENKLRVLEFFQSVDNNCYLEIDDEFSFAFEEMTIKNSNIFLFDKYDLISDDFIINHPISTYLNDDMIDRKTCLLKEDVDIHMFMIGMGHVNRHLYLELIKNNQYAKSDHGRIQTYKVKYHLFNKDKVENSNLNHKLRRIRYMNVDRSKYYPWIEDSFEFESHIEDINSFHFYQKVHENMAMKGLNVFIVSLGDDLLNIDIALKLNDRLKNWELEGKYVVFVRVKCNANINFNLPESIVCFGSDEKILSKDTIICDRLLEIAKKRAALYSQTEDIDGNWMNLSLSKRLSNKNSVFSLIHKFGLLGLKITDSNEEEGITKEEYFALYDREQDIQRDENNKVIYPLVFSHELNPRNVIAYLEHNRWVVDMLTKGYIPMPKEMVQVKDHVLFKDDPFSKRHACITSFDGLDEYFADAASKIVADKNISYREAYAQVENKKYDYEIMDEAYHLLTSIGYKISRIDS